MIPAPEGRLEAPSPMSQNGSEPQNSGVAAKAFVSMTPCLLCLYVNGVMLFSLCRRPASLESSRYLLFGHLLLSDSLHLLACVALYLVAVARARLGRLLCVFLLLLGDAVAKASPFTLALMSLERYVAVCLPLRHAGVSTPRRTGATLTVVWCVAAVDPVSELLYFLALDDRPNARQRPCKRQAALGWALFGRINTAFNAVYFLLVGGVILYTYVRILLAARSAAAAAVAGTSAAGSRASAARRTVLIHMLQLCLCLASTTFNAMSSLVMLSFGVVMARNVQYLLFLSLVIFPRVLSPLIYGLRDKAFRRIFTHYFLFGLRTHRKPLA
ncbi:odorant receptor 131-2-like [Gadus morhua]|uniref:odorant receptor 131-2-like n=1 Tax=Gadus morhua TaxID=8049 RepID=UPI0011B63447|nr:odorant receptor 131-2-like [Gadus morhua]